jgi:hypothetical protein
LYLRRIGPAKILRPGRKSLPMPFAKAVAAPIDVTDMFIFAEATSFLRNAAIDSGLLAFILTFLHASVS